MINVALLGLGRIGKEHFYSYKQLSGVQLVKIVDKNLAENNYFINGKQIEFSSDIDQIINDKSIDAIDICLPTFLHADIAIKAANAGKHVFCEKPMALDLDQCDEMIHAARVNNIKLMIGQLLRFVPEYAAAKKIVSNGKIGTLLSFTGRRLVSYPQYSESGWLQNEKLSGGAAFDLMIHDIDAINWFFDGKNPVSITASGLSSKSGSLDHIFASFEFENGSKGFIDGGWIIPQTFPFSMEFQIVGTDGFLKYHSHGLSSRERHQNSENTSLMLYHDDNSIAPKIQQKDSITAELDYFYQSILNNTTNQIITPEDAKRSVEWTLKVKKAALTGEKLILR